MLFQARKEMEEEGSEDMNMITETRIVLTVANVFDGMNPISLPIIYGSICIASVILRNKRTT